jgi:hypothetical protein
MCGCQPLTALRTAAQQANPLFYAVREIMNDRATPLHYHRAKARTLDGAASVSGAD